MWFPTFIAGAISIFAAVLQTTLVRKGIIKEKSKNYKLIEVLGLYIPAAFVCGNIGYLKTDTSFEAFIVTIGLYFCFLLWASYLSTWKTSRYNFIIFPSIFFFCYFIVQLITPYMLSSIDSIIFSSIIGSSIGVSIPKNKYKVRVIISGIILILLILTVPHRFLNRFEAKNKTERVSFSYLRDIGFNITQEDELVLWESANRYKPTCLTFFRNGSPENLTMKRQFYLTYYNGEVTHMENIK